LYLHFGVWFCILKSSMQKKAAQLLQPKSTKSKKHSFHIVPVMAIFAGFLTATALIGYTARNIYVNAVGATRYVNPASGVNSGDCTALSSPCKTLQFAASKAQAGDAILVRGGVYKAATKTDFKVSNVAGTATSPLIIKPYPGESVTLDGSAVAFGSTESLVEFDTVNNLRFEGFTIQNSSGRGVSYKNATNITIANNKITGMKYRALGGWADGAVLEGNELWNNALMNSAKTLSSGWPGVIQTASKYGSGTPQLPSKNIVIRNNKIYDSYGEGIIANFADGVTIANNTIFDTYSINIYLDHAKNVTVENNYLYATKANFYKGTKRANGITIATEQYGAEEPKIKPENITIKNNIIAGAEKGVSYYAAPGTGSYNSYATILILHNTIYNPADMALKFDAPLGGAPMAASAFNNILYKGAAATAYQVENPNSWTFGSNVWSPAVPSGTAHATDIGMASVPFADPLIGGPAVGFTLLQQLPSAGQNKGVQTDFFGIARNTSAPTIGAHEFGTSTPPAATPTPSTAPSAPPVASPSAAPVGNVKPVFTTVSLSSPRAGRSMNIAIVGKDSNKTDTLTMTATAVPAGTTFGGCVTSTGTANTKMTCYLKGIVTTKGSYPVDVYIQDQTGARSTKTYTLVVR
jgi:hypothetical protein